MSNRLAFGHGRYQGSLEAAAVVVVQAVDGVSGFAATPSRPAVVVVVMAVFSPAVK